MAYKRPPDEDEEPSPHANDFEKMLDESFQKNHRKLNPGDKVRVEVLSVGREHTIVSTGTIHDGFVPTAQLLDAEGKPRVKTGDTLDLYVTSARGQEILLSPSPTAKNLADNLSEAYAQRQVVEGRVDEVTKGGFRVTLLGKSAFCPVSQMDLKFIEHPEEYVGKKFEFHLTKFSEGGRDIVVSRRRVLEEERTRGLSLFRQERRPGDVFAGVVTRLEKFGAFVEIAPGVEGLAHISEISWSRINHPGDVLELGQPVSATLLRVEPDGDRLKISLTLKQSEAEPWRNLPAEVEAGRVLTGKVTRCMPFGAFVELFPGIEGLIPLSEMSHTKRVARSDEIVKEQELVTVMVKEVNPQAKRISLSLKDAGEDPWASVPDQFPVGRTLEGTIERREAFGLFIRLGEGVTGLMPKSKALENEKFAFDKVRPGDAIKVRISEVRATERRISLEFPDASGADDWRDFSAQTKKSMSAAPAVGSLGERLKAAMEKGTKK